MPSNETGWSSVDAEVVRVTRVDAAGAAVAGASSGYVAGLISLAVAAVVTTGQKIEQRNGRGSLCVSIQEPDHITGSTLTLTLCQLDAQLLELLTGSVLLLDEAGNAIGVSDPAPDAADPAGYVLEGWSRAINVNQQAVVGGHAAYYRHVFGRCKGVRGNFTIANGAIQIPVTITAQPNSVMALANGPAGDWPDGIVGSWAVFLDAAAAGIPEDAIGYQTVPWAA